MNPVLALALLLAAGLAATRLTLPHLRRNTSTDLAFSLALGAGAPFLLAGLILGPGLGVLDRETLRTLTPVTALGIGWIGAAFGAQLEWRLLRRIPRRAWVFAALQAGAALVLTIVAARLLTRVAPALSHVWRPTVPSLLTLGAVAVVSGSTAVGLVARTLRVSPALTRALGLAALLDTALGALVFALALGWSQPHRTFAGAALGWAHWIAVAVVAIGGVGVLFVWLSRLREADGDALGLEVLAIVLIASGLGYAADLSPFIVCALTMALIVNLSPLKRRVQTLLWSWQHHVYALFLVAVGALLDVPTLWLVPAAVVLCLVRLATRWKGSLGTVAQGAVPLALALSFNLTYTGSGGSLLTTIFLGVVLSQALAVPAMALALRAAPPKVS